MKAVLILSALMLTGSNFANAQDPQCSIPEFCQGKVDGMLALLNNRCYSDYLEFPKETSQGRKIAKSRMRDCISWVSSEWNRGFGKQCRGMAAQEACFQKMRAYKLEDVGTQACHYF